MQNAGDSNLFFYLLSEPFYHPAVIKVKKEKRLVLYDI
jgi:hypothetical protein